jgi:hypothetical protein
MEKHIQLFSVAGVKRGVRAPRLREAAAIIATILLVFYVLGFTLGSGSRSVKVCGG